MYICLNSSPGIQHSSVIVVLLQIENLNILLIFLASVKNTHAIMTGRFLTHLLN